MSSERGSDLYPCRRDEIAEGIARMLARVAHHMHPDVVAHIREANRSYRSSFEKVAPESVEVEAFLFEGSDVVFPGSRRFIGTAEKALPRHYFYDDLGVIMDWNYWPRYLWSFLAIGAPYNAKTWKSSGMGAFELAHIFPHKPDEALAVRRLWAGFPVDNRVWSLFTSAGSVVLMPRGVVRPTDFDGAVKACFFQRFIDLYGAPPLPGLSVEGLVVPSWYSSLEWATPVLPAEWKSRTQAALAYREERLAHVFANKSRRAAE